MSIRRILAYALTSLLITGVGLALWNRIAGQSALARRVLGLTV